MDLALLPNNLLGPEPCVSVGTEGWIPVLFCAIPCFSTDILTANIVMVL